jgi:aspartyl-tRNA(Asn)/glutamyl-tRNA(Gln) amidotransferase subunit C
MSSKIISQVEVKKIAKLANLPLTAKEVTLFQKQLSQVLEYFKVLNKVETKKVKETSQVTGLVNVSRPDKTQPSLTIEKVLKNVPKKHNNYIQVKAIFED